MSTFDDFEDDGPDDSDALGEYAEELMVAVEAFGVTPLETGVSDEDFDIEGDL